MQGQSEKLLYDVPVDGAYEYRLLSDSLVPLKNPCGENIREDGSEGCELADSGMTRAEWIKYNVLRRAVDGKTTLVPAFCEAYINAAKKRGAEAEVIAVHAAKGATQLDYWMEGTAANRLLLLKSVKAAEAAGNVRHRFFVWLQGESDAIAAVKKDEYKAMLSRFGLSLEKALGIERFGIIRVGRYTDDDRDLEIIAAQDEICREDEFFVMLTDKAADFTTLDEYKPMLNPRAHGHYSALGLCRLGELAGTELAEYI